MRQPDLRACAPEHPERKSAVEISEFAQPGERDVVARVRRGGEEHQYACALCATGYEPSLDEMVEVSFTVSPRVRKIAAHSPDVLPMWEYVRQMYWSSGIEFPPDQPLQDLLQSVVNQYPDEKELHERVRLYLNICERHVKAKKTDPQTVEAVTAAAREGTSFGTATEREVELAEEIVAAVPSVEMVRLVSSGTEAAMTALRLARAATGREPFVRFRGNYHGHADPFLSEAGSGIRTLAIDARGDGGVVDYNDLEAVERRIEGAACVFVEPVAGNMGLVRPTPEFLADLRRLTHKYGALLIFDEVMTGFRVAYGGAQALLGVTPDLTALGKVIGGGLPVGAYGGRADVMKQVSPSGPVFQAGTLSGNPLATAAGLSVLRRLTPEVYDQLEAKGRRLDALGQFGRFERVGAMATLFVDDYPALFRHLLERGLYLAPSQNEAMFLSTAHGDEEIERTLEAVADAVS